MNGTQISSSPTETAAYSLYLHQLVAQELLPNRATDLHRHMSGFGRKNLYFDRHLHPHLQRAVSSSNQKLPTRRPFYFCKFLSHPVALAISTV